MAESRIRERGEGRIGCFLTLVALAAAVAVGLKVVPVYYANSSLAETAEEVAAQAGVSTVPSMAARLRAKAMELDIPEAVAEGAIAISTHGEKNVGSCSITFDYKRAVDLYGVYTVNIETHKVVTRPYMDAR